MLYFWGKIQKDFNRISVMKRLFLLWMGLILMGWAWMSGCWQSEEEVLCSWTADGLFEKVPEAAANRDVLSVPVDKSDDAIGWSQELLAGKTLAEVGGGRMFRVCPVDGTAWWGKFQLRRIVRFIQHQVAVEEGHHAVVYRIGRKGDLSLYTYAIRHILI